MSKIDLTAGERTDMIRPDGGSAPITAGISQFSPIGYDRRRGPRRVGVAGRAEPERRVRDRRDTPGVDRLLLAVLQLESVEQEAS